MAYLEGLRSKKGRKVGKSAIARMLQNNAHCGCSLTAERKKGKYVYYHCTGNRGGCSKPFVREEALTQAFCDLLDRIWIPSEVVEWVSGELTRESRDEEAARQARLKLEETRLQALYMDKLSGNVPLDVYRAIKGRREGPRPD